MKHSRYEHASHRLCRDSERGVILGVCAGIAERFDLPLWLTRIAALAIGWVLTVPAIVAYLVAAMVMPDRPLHYCGEDERAFWQSRNRRS